MAIRTINLEAGFPTVAEALVVLNYELNMAKPNRVKALKIIHGYGSSGKGGAIKRAVRRELENRKNSGRIKLFVPGENFTVFYEEARTAVALCSQVRSDSDYGRENDGITIILF